MAEGKEGEKKRGPKGGIKHTPGRGHDTKSGPVKTKRFSKRAAKKRKARNEKARQEWQQYDRLSEEARKLVGPKGKPKLPRPKDES